MTKATGLLCAAALAVGAITAQAQTNEPLDTPHFVPLDPCRIADSRKYPSTHPYGPLVTDTLAPLGSTVTRSIVVRGLCGIPSEVRKADAIAYNLTVAGGFNQQAFHGHILVFPSDLVQVPVASSLNFAPLQNISNASIIRLNPCPSWDTSDPTNTCTRRPGDISLHMYLANAPNGTPSLGGAVYWVLDVVGYFKR